MSDKTISRDILAGGMPSLATQSTVFLRHTLLFHGDGEHGRVIRAVWLWSLAGILLLLPAWCALQAFPGFLPRVLPVVLLSSP